MEWAPQLTLDEVPLVIRGGEHSFFGKEEAQAPREGIAWCF